VFFAKKQVQFPKNATPKASKKEKKAKMPKTEIDFSIICCFLGKRQIALFFWNVKHRQK